MCFYVKFREDMQPNITGGVYYRRLLSRICGKLRRRQHFVLMDLDITSYRHCVWTSLPRCTQSRQYCRVSFLLSNLHCGVDVTVFCIGREQILPTLLTLYTLCRRSVGFFIYLQFPSLKRSATDVVHHPLTWVLLSKPHQYCWYPCLIVTNHLYANTLHVVKCATPPCHICYVTPHWSLIFSGG